jgi:NRAMP (natural resistance-associated macrophage protein)-like metal ion transporter
MRPIPRLYYFYRRTAKQLAILFAVMGPGIIVMVADNDAGGITTYAVSGARYEFNLVLLVALFAGLAYFVQEMTVRLGAITKRGHAEAIFDGFGPFWGWFSLIDLTVVNFLTIVTEFIGMVAATSIFGIPPLLTVFAGIAFLTALVITGRYWTFERIALVLCLVNMVYIPAAFLARPNWNVVIHNVFFPSFPNGLTTELLTLIMANIGTTVAPWMLFFQQSAVVDKQLDEKDIPYSKIDTAFGSILTGAGAAFIMIATGTALHATHPNITHAAEAATALVPFAGRNAGALFAIGLFDAGLLGAICISLASSWAFGEVFGWAHTLNVNVKSAPWFYLFYILNLALAGAVVLIPGAPFVLITLFVQVVAVTLLPAALVFLILLLNDKPLMGPYVNTKLQNAIDWIIVGAIIAISSLYGVSTIFPNLFGR